MGTFVPKLKLELPKKSVRGKKFKLVYEKVAKKRRCVDCKCTLNAYNRFKRCHSCRNKENARIILEGV